MALAKPLLIAWADTETNGLLKDLDRIHCLGAELSDDRVLSCANQPGYMPIEEGLAILEEADVIVGHNWQDFDDRAIRKVYPKFKPRGKVIDTLLWSRLQYPEIQRDGPNNHKLPGNLRRAHSLKSWGLRLGNHKGDYEGGWGEWSPEMHDYMLQDVSVLRSLFKWLRAHKPVSWSIQTGWNRREDKPIYNGYSYDKLCPPPEASALEHEFALIIRRLESRGFTFDHAKALQLQAVLQTKEAELETALIDSFGSWWQPSLSATKEPAKYDFSQDDDEEELTDEELEERQKLEALQSTPRTITVRKSRKVKMLGVPEITRPRFSVKGRALKPYVGPPLIEYDAGAIYTPVEFVQFNPGSRHHVRRVLQSRYGWKPEKFTPNKKNPQPIVDDDVLKGLPYPEAALLAEYYTVLKRLGQLATGNKAWLLLAVQDKDEWRVHGRINTNGAVTGRCTHSNPNIAQTPKANARTPYGVEMRGLWIPRKGYKLVGFDGSGMQLRMLAHYLARFDGGAYAKIVCEQDPHAWLRDTVGVDIIGEGELGRDYAKTEMYAYIFGASNLKLGSIIDGKASRAARLDLGATIRSRINNRFEAVGQLSGELERFVEDFGYIEALDKRMIRIRKRNAILNSLLMSGEAVVMKRALIILDNALQSDGFTPGLEYEFVANIHDEDQAEVRDDRATLDHYKARASECVRDAGLYYKLKCPLKSDAKEGYNWAETH